ncbi:DUF3500 domain-containing protein [Mycobacterium sp. 1465703.0]|uniref:DUF3500 domain-containing protein n=1 Tax=Mycobacterium sp. 1465703.0 TaxID=1834078 RepID=UPI0018D3E801|nr:DUF3500 domain-containing protein [Mycobacterium sp. 1465703.0]
MSGLDKLTPTEYAEVMRQTPVLGDVIKYWMELFESTSFNGISSDGNIIEGLFELGADEGAPTAKASEAAENLLKALTLEDRTKICHPLDSRVWRAWMNPEFYLLPYGLRLEDLDSTTLALVMSLIQASVSDKGYRKIVDLMRINDFLGHIVGVPNAINVGSYNINIFGTPSLHQPWGWNFWGHHVCLNVLFLGKQQVFTPVFFGAEPNEIDEGEHAGTIVFVEQDRAGLDLVQSLTRDQADKAILFHHKRDPKMPPGRIALGDELHLGGCFQDNRVIPYEGINARDLAPGQRERLVRIVELFLDYQPPGPLAARINDVRRHLDDTWFCWIGGTADDAVFYYRIQSPVIMVEFDHHAGLALSNPEPERFHVHTTIRTPNGNDYGVQLVRAATSLPQRLI